MAITGDPVCLPSGSRLNLALLDCLSATALADIAPITPPNLELGAQLNSFNPVTRIRFVLPESISVNLSIYDALGRRVCGKLSEAWCKAGEHSVIWDGKTDSGAEPPSGIYLLQPAAGAHEAAEKLTLLC